MKHPNQKQILEKTKKHVRKAFGKEGSGHDWWHVERVLNNVLAIAKKERGADLFIVQLGALLHDIADHKFHGGDDKVGGRVAAELLQKFGVDQEAVKKIVHIVDNVSFKGLAVKSKMKSLEGKIVQDADRLEALGALGIARAFSYGGYRQRPMYIPGHKPKIHKNFAQFKKLTGSTIDHFYEKLLHVKDLMNTKTGKQLARNRHKYLQDYLKQFYAEWEGKR